MVSVIYTHNDSRYTHYDEEYHVFITTSVILSSPDLTNPQDEQRCVDG